MCNIYTPYTYLIGWSEKNAYYYGVRYASKCHPSDLWNKYFTSSKYVRSFRTMHGEPDIIQIRKTFTTAYEAIKWEDRVLQKMKLHERSDFLNKNTSTCIFVNGRTVERVLKTKKSRTYEKRPSWNKGLTKYTDERLLKVSMNSKNKPKSEESKLKMRKPKSNTNNMGRYVRSEETKHKISSKYTGIVKEKADCQFCNSPKQLGKQLAKHEQTCTLNPNNHRFCPICSKIIKSRQGLTCSHSCQNRYRFIFRLCPENLAIQ